MRGGAAAVWVFSSVALAGAPAQRYVQVSSAWLRAEPRDEAKKLGKLRIHQPLRVLETSNGWAKVDLPEGFEGWVKERLLTELPARPDELLLERRAALEPTDARHLAALRDEAASARDDARASWYGRLLSGDVPVWFAVCRLGERVVLGRDVPGRGFEPLAAPEKLTKGRRAELADELISSDWFSVRGVEPGPFRPAFADLEPGQPGWLLQGVVLRHPTPCTAGDVLATRPITEGTRRPYDFRRAARAVEALQGVLPDPADHLDAFRTESGLDLVTVRSEAGGWSRAGLFTPAGALVAATEGHETALSTARWVKLTFGGRQLGVVLVRGTGLTEVTQAHVWQVQPNGSVKESILVLEGGGC